MADNFSRLVHLSPHLTKINGNVNSHFRLNPSSPLFLVLCRQMLDILFIHFDSMRGFNNKMCTIDIIEPFFIIRLSYFCTLAAYRLSKLLIFIFHQSFSYVCKYSFTHAVRLAGYSVCMTRSRKKKRVSMTAEC